VPYRQIIITTIILLMFAIIGTTLVAVTYEGTRDQIAANERATLLRKLHRLIAPEQHDNVLLEDVLAVRDVTLLGTDEPVTVYRARKDGKPVSLVIETIAPDGYSGTIRLLVGINIDGSLSGVRVVGHRETPGLGDAIDETRSDWIHVFDGKSLDNPEAAGWAVRKDGGSFDQLTGATITPRAVVKAVRNALLYYRQHQETLFEPTGDADATGNSPP
jgi:electron transport complex protein RnfG